MLKRKQPRNFSLRNFVCHLTTLHQASIISSEALFLCISNTQEAMAALEETRTVVGQAWLEQRERVVEQQQQEREQATASPSRMVRWEDCSGLMYH